MRDTMNNPRIRERCPSCGNDTLFVTDSGALVCSWIGGGTEKGCQQPVVSEFIADLQTKLREAETARDKNRQSVEALSKEHTKQCEANAQLREALTKMVDAWNNRGESTSLHIWNERMKDAVIVVTKALGREA